MSTFEVAVTTENLRVLRYSGAKFPNLELIHTIQAGTEEFLRLVAPPADDLT